MLRYIQRTETDPYYNLAAEEYLLKTATTDTMMIWRNETSVIVGKHQNAAREINPSYVEALQIPVIRRITGGGAVYHDTGNVNFSFIYTNRKDNLVDFRYFTKPVIGFLNEFGLNAVFEGKNNICVNGLKVSGNSAHIFRQKVLHHGTLLFSSDLAALENAISGRDGLFKDKAVGSIRSEVANIAGMITDDISIEGFIILFHNYIFKNFNEIYEDELHIDEVNAITELAEKKYKTYEWNFGYSPEYQFHNEWLNKDGRFSVSINVKEGRISRAEIKGPDNYTSFLDKMAVLITGTHHEKKSIKELREKLIFANASEQQLLDQIISNLF